MSNPRFIVATRDDLLGGRLVPILNGLRIARITGAKFLMTWYTDATEVQSYVAGLREIFAGELVEPYDDATGRGTIIPIGHPLASATAEIKPLHCEEGAPLGIGDLFVAPVFDGAAYRLDRRFSLYSMRETDTPAAVAAELQDEFRAMPKHPLIEAGIADLDRAASSQIVSLHARRLHIHAGSLSQLNRFDSYIDTSFYLSMLDHLRDRGTRVIAASDNGAFIRRLRDHAPDMVHQPMQSTAATQIQQAMLEMYEMGRTAAIFGCLSAFNFAASLIAGAKLVNIAHAAAELGLPGHDITGRVAFESARLRGEFSHLAAERDARATLCAKVAGGLEPTLAARSVALRLTEYCDLSKTSDIGWFTHYAATSMADDADMAKAVAIIERAARCQGGPAIAPDRKGKAWAYLRVAADAANGDAAAVRSDCMSAIGFYDSALRAIPSLQIPAVGLRTKLGTALLRSGNIPLALDTMRGAARDAPDYPSPWFALAHAENEAGDKQAAIDALRRCVALEPEHGLYWFNLGAALGDGEAEQCFRLAHECEPGNQRYRDAARAAAA